MSNTSSLEDLKAFISIQTDEELVWVLHVFNKSEVAYHFSELTKREREISGLKSDIDNLNSFKQLKDIKSFIIKYCEDYRSSRIDDLLDDLLDFKSGIEVSGIDFTVFKNNKRFLNFACKLLNEDVREKELTNFKSQYINFLYVALTYRSYYENPRRIERVVNKFSDIYSKYPSHFKGDEDNNFYIWAKKYMDENLAYRSKSYSPTEESEYCIVVNSIFDMLYYENEEVHYALRKKISNAWYQKVYRKKNKGKKAHHYVLQKKTLDSLHSLAFKWKMSHEEVLEKLIDKSYAEECTDFFGECKYQPA